jgi:hypothetical protein
MHRRRRAFSARLIVCVIVTIHDERRSRPASVESRRRGSNGMVARTATGSGGDASGSRQCEASAGAANIASVARSVATCGSASSAYY